MEVLNQALAQGVIFTTKLGDTGYRICYDLKEALDYLVSLLLPPFYYLDSRGEFLGSGDATVTCCWAVAPATIGTT